MLIVLRVVQYTVLGRSIHHVDVPRQCVSTEVVESDDASRGVTQMDLFGLGPRFSCTLLPAFRLPTFRLPSSDLCQTHTCLCLIRGWVKVNRRQGLLRTRPTEGI